MLTLQSDQLLIDDILSDNDCFRDASPDHRDPRGLADLEKRASGIWRIGPSIQDDIQHNIGIDKNPQRYFPSTDRR